nr:hypothetical protein [Tanacetum cinerariifolium]
MTYPYHWFSEQVGLADLGINIFALSNTLLTNKATTDQSSSSLPSPCKRHRVSPYSSSSVLPLLSSDGPSCKRGRSPTTSLTSTDHSSTTLSPIQSDLLPPRKRLRDLPSAFHQETSIEDSTERGYKASMEGSTEIGLDIDIGADLGINIFALSNTLLTNKATTDQSSSSLPSPCKRHRVSPYSSSSVLRLLSSDGPSCKRGRSPTTSLTSTDHSSTTLSPIQADLLPPRKRLRDLPSAFHQETSIEDSTERGYKASMEGSTEIGLDTDIGAGAEVGTEVGADASVRDTIEIDVDVVVEPDTPHVLPKPTIA